MNIESIVIGLGIMIVLLTLYSFLFGGKVDASSLSGRNIIMFIILTIVVILIYSYFFEDNRESKLSRSVRDATTMKIISAKDFASSTNTNYTYSIWFYVKDWNYRFGEPKIIFGRTDNNNDPAPSVILTPSLNNINVSLAVYPTKESQQAQIHTCTLNNVPLQTWANLIMTINNRALDLYLDGKLVRTCILPGVPKVVSSSNVLLTPDGGFSGNTADFRYLNYAINPSQAYDIYKQGFGGGGILSSLGGLVNKYKIKIAFLENNKELNSFEL